MSYFAQDYFGANFICMAPNGAPDVDSGPLTDGIAMSWIRDTLVTSNLFEWVGKGARAGASRTTSSFPSAWIWPVSFKEDDTVDPDQFVRTLKFAVSIAVRGESDDANQDQLDRLSGSVANLIGGIGPVGSLPGLTSIDGGLYDTPTNSSTSPVDGQAGNGSGASVRLAGSLAYLVEGRTARPAE